MSAPIDPDFVARIAARALYANIVISLVAAGILMFMSIYGLSVFLETPKKFREGRTPYVVLSFILSGLMMLTASLDASWIFQRAFGATSGRGFAQSVSQHIRVWDRFLSIGSMTAVIFIGDALLIYRCYVIWSHRWWVTVLPGLTLLASTIMGIFAIVVEIDEKQQPTFESARTFLNVLTNVMVTGLISFYILRARRALAQLLPAEDMRIYTGIVAILIESALPLTVFGIIYAVLGTVGVPKTTQAAARYLVVWYASSALFFSFCALSPTMIIFRITTGRSWVRFPTGSDRVSNPIDFGRPSVHDSSLVTDSQDPAWQPEPERKPDTKMEV